MTTAAPLHPLPAGPLLVCAATRIELAAFNADERLGLSDNRPFAPAAADDGQAAYLLTGVGTPCTLGRLFALASGPEQATPPFRLVLNIGIAGAGGTGAAGTAGGAGVACLGSRMVSFTSKRFSLAMMRGSNSYGLSASRSSRL